jgi:N-acetylglucosaminyldiphosphoundecaprenol N-acetyl-beta-D-mannosaminyltransferase
MPDVEDAHAATEQVNRMSDRATPVIPRPRVPAGKTVTGAVDAPLMPVPARRPAVGAPWNPLAPAAVHVLGVPVHAVTLDAVLDACDRVVERRGQLNIGVVNAAKLVRMRDDDRLRRAVLASDLVLADGQSVVWASRILQRPLPARVAGIDLFLALLDRAERRCYSVYFLGATDAVLSTMVHRLRAQHPRLRIGGYRNGYFSPEESAQIADEIRAARPDVVFVGITSPRKELFLEEWSSHIGAHVYHGVGGSFDVVAGVVRRAPLLWQRLGLEWLYRVKQEPRRLWKRYLTTNAAFLTLLAKELVTRHRSTPTRPGPQEQTR